MTISAAIPTTLSGMTFDSNFECGNAVSFAELEDGVISFRLAPDTNGKDRQWYLFRVRGGRGRRVTFRLDGLSETNVPIHWKDACPVIGPGLAGPWGRSGGNCGVIGDGWEFTLVIPFDETYIGFHHPYGYERNLRQIERWCSHPSVTREVIGHSIEKRPIDLLRVREGGVEAGRLGVWVTCRQHAGESNASWFLDGFMEWLLSAEGAPLRKAATVNVVPMINPDGVIAGNYRLNAAGVNLNRVWNKPDPATSPEILAVTSAVRRWVDSGNRYDFFIDLHGDSEALACYAFQPGASIKPPKYHSPHRYHADSRRYIAMVASRAPDFHPDEGVVETDDVGLSRQFMTFEYGVMAELFEMGYSTVNYGPNAGLWLTPERHGAIGRAAGESLAEYLLGGC
ncbi:hypothetical protein GC173_01105 [bacterium]|nr:hypothetical protein [bacterium]